MPSPFLAAVGNAGQGFQQGASSAADMRTKMMQLQQLQMALDQAQKILTAQGDYYKTMSAPASPGGAPSGVPAGPGSPPPAGPGPFAPAGPGTPTSSPFSMGGQPPSPPMQPGGMAPPRPPMAPQGGVPPQGGLPTPRPNPMRGPAPPMQPQGGQPQGQGGPPPQQGGGQGSTVLQQYAQALNSGQMDSQTMIQDMARKIAQTNPGIDPEIGFKILQQGIDMMHSIGLSPEAKLNSALTLAMLKGAQGQDLENLRQGGRIQLADENGKNHEMWVDDQGKFHMAGIEAQQEGANARQGERDTAAMARLDKADSDRAALTTKVQNYITARSKAGLDNKGVQRQWQTLNNNAQRASQVLRTLQGAITKSPQDIQKAEADFQAANDALDSFISTIPRSISSGPSGRAGPAPGAASSSKLTPQALDAMIKKAGGIDAAIAKSPDDATTQALTSYYEKSKGIGPGATPRPPAKAAPRAGGSVTSQANPASPTTQQQFDALPPGAWFKNPADGRVLQKKQ